GSPPTRTVVDISDLPGFTKAFKITTSAINQGIQQTVPIVPNQEYILSWWAKDEGNLNDNHIQVFYTDLNTGNTLYLNTGEIRTLSWQRYTWNRKINANAITIRIGRGGGGSNYGTTYFTGLKLEKGNKATDWTRAEEDVKEQIDEAKQEAEEAKQTAQQAQTTADGKNTVFRQSSQPPTAGRKIGDVWFDTSRDNLMHVFNGTQWVEAKIG